MKNQQFKAMYLYYFVLLFGFYNAAQGYETGTHEAISKAASQQFVDLKHYDFANLGLVSLDDNLTAEGLKCRSEKLSTKSAIEWIQEGSFCEDDTRTEVYFRYKNHFYDPQHAGQGYSGFLWKDSGIINGMPAPDWIIDKGPADGQLYSFSQGRQYFYKALTKLTDAERKDNLARMFRTLGDVMHVLQDMAQPQHTRDDSHGTGSWYEGYTDQKRKEGSLIYEGATATPFATAREYFTDLAQFSSTNFVSADTNFDKAAHYGYTLPAQGAATDVLVHTLPGISPEISAKCNASKPCVMTFYSTSQTVTNAKASALSILDQYLKLRPVTITDPVTSTSYSENRVFMLNRFTFDTALPILIPRAVAYSAGILDYFFRGQIDMVPDTGNPGKYLIRNKGTEDMTGNFALYYDAVDGNRYPVPGAVWSGLPVAANSQANNLSFTWPDNPAPQTPGEFTLVFKGTMGAEQAGHSSTGAVDSSIGAVVAKKVSLACRKLSIVMASVALPTLTINVVESGSGNEITATSTVTIRNYKGDIVNTVTGTQVETRVYLPDTTLQQNITWNSFLDGYMQGGIVRSYMGGGQYQMHLSGWPSPYKWGVMSGSFTYPPNSGSVTWTDLGWDALLAEANTSGGNSTRILLSDGTQLASFPYTVLDAQGHKADYPISTTWTGNDWLDLYTDTNDGNGNWAQVFSQRVTFTVPSGVCNP